MTAPGYSNTSPPKNGDLEWAWNLIRSVTDYLDTQRLVSGRVLEVVTDSERKWLVYEVLHSWDNTAKHGELYSALYYTVMRIIAILSMWQGFQDAGGKSVFEPIPSWIMEYVESIPPKSRRCSKVIIVIPTLLRREVKRLITIIRSLAQYYKVVVVGGWKEGSEKILYGISNVYTYRVEGNDSPARSRNIGIEISLDYSAEVIVFMDDDTIPNINGIRVLVNNACGRGIALPKAKALGNTEFDVFHDYEGTLNGVYLGSNERLLYATTFLAAVDVSLLDAGLRFSLDFPTSAGEDIDFSLKAIKIGGFIIPVDDVLIKHDYGYEHRQLMEFVNRYKRYGIGNAILLRKHPYYYTSLTLSKPRRTIPIFSGFMKRTQLFREIKNILPIPPNKS